MATLMGKKVLVIGGNSGIGLGVAAAALEKGAEVILVGRSREKLQAAERSVAALGEVATFAADMTKETEIEQLFAQIGAFDHLVSTAGTPPPGDPIKNADIEVIRDFIDNKLVGTVIVAKHAARTLTKGGSMTFTSGINKDKPPVPGGSVVAAIAGSFGYLAHALSLELAPTRVNIVSPGWVDTPMFTDLAGDHKSALFEAMAKQLPVGRIAKPADVAPAFIYLMESEFTTGQTLRIDGGQSLI